MERVGEGDRGGGWLSIEGSCWFLCMYVFDHCLCVCVNCCCVSVGGAGCQSEGREDPSGPGEDQGGASQKGKVLTYTHVQPDTVLFYSTSCPFPL